MVSNLSPTSGRDLPLDFSGIRFREDYVLWSGRDAGGLLACLLILTSRFEAIRGYVGTDSWFELMDDDEDSTELARLSKFHATTTEGRLASRVRWGVQQAPYTADLRWNRVSNLEPLRPKAETH
ncbi:hypothetical protein AVEN_265492-1 [Araneus ventricosus]|uniref:Uncharacterized protein n=1 Tax=Araneus ventricosus TaxID=182803 RepID=A0A4Y2QEJ6_ARAVE|nr:hypothetical protein AVEN_265492-1 [Araneus ventricosus]